MTTSPSVNSYCLLLALLFSPAVGPLFPAVVALFTRCGSALLSSIRSTITAKFTESADSSSVLLRAVRHALRDVLVCRTWSAGLTSTTVLSLRVPRVKVCEIRAQLLWFASTSFIALANGLSMTSIVLRVYCFGLRAHVPPKLFEFCSHRCVWPCASWSDTLVLIDLSACLVEPRTRDRRIKCVPHGPLTVFLREPHRAVFCAVLHRPLTYSQRSLPAPG